MNDLGSLATDIVNYSYPDDTGRFPVGFVSGWLETRIGSLNALTHEEFEIDSTGAVIPSLCMDEEDIFKGLYDINYYERGARESLRGIIWDGAINGAISMVKEGDSTIQKTSNHQISKTYSQLAEEARESLKNLLYQYNMNKASAVQVTGEDGDSFNYAWDSNQY